MTNKHDPRFINVSVHVTKNSDGTFTPKYEPEVITVTASDSVINFQLAPTTNKHIKVRKVRVHPEDNDQLSDPIISKSGRQVIISDVNSLPDKFNLTFKFTEGDIQALAKCSDSEERSVADYPEIDNVPPG